MTFGINTFLFASPFTNASSRWFSKFKAWGFDAVEIAIEDPSDIDPVFVRKELDANGLVCKTVCAAMGPGRDLRGSVADQSCALEYIHKLFDLMPVLGADLLVGPLYSSVGRAEQVSRDQYALQWETVTQHLRQLAYDAGRQGLRMGIEPLNRFESDFINTTDQAIALVRAVNSPALGLHLDTFHMNIEEKNLPGAIERCGDLLWHIHACGTDRGTPGRDHTDWIGIAKALQRINYDGGIVIESFSMDTKAMAKAAAIWRPFERSKEDIAQQGIAFLKQVLAKPSSKE